MIRFAAFLWTMAFVYLAQRKLLFSQRERFWKELRPFASDGRRIVLPEGMMAVRWGDYRRAMLIARARPMTLDALSASPGQSGS